MGGHSGRATTRLCLLALAAIVLCGQGILAAAPGPKPGPPTVVQVYPSDGMKYVPVDTAIHIVFSEPMTESAAIQAIHVTPALQLVYPSSWQFLNDRTIMVVVPARPLRYSTTYTVTVRGSARDSQGVEMGHDYSWSFTTVASPPSPSEAPVNGGFATGDIAGWEFGHEEASGSRAATWSVGPSGDREHALKFSRPPTFERGSCWIEQAIRSELPAFGLAFLSFDMRIDSYTLKEYTDGSTYPLKVTIRYRDKAGAEFSFSKAFYYHLPVEGGVDSFAEFVELGRWSSRSYNLSALVPRPAYLESIRFECSGWAWTVFLDDIRLVW